MLFETTATIAQIYTYSAYVELLAKHNSSGVVDSTATKTSILYNGEALDPKTGLYNFRARWYSPNSGRFERLDPYAGNSNDPFSFNKYGFVHGAPVQGIDPTDMFFSLGGMMATIANMNIGQALNGTATYIGRQGAIAGIETALELAIGTMISAATGIKFDYSLEEIDRSFSTNWVSNVLTGGLGKMHLLRNLLDFAVRMISDVAIAGQNIYWAAAVNLMSMGASGLLLSKYGQKIFGECVGRFGGCFVAGTPVVVGYQADPVCDLFAHSDSGATLTACRTITKAIETISLGSRVITEAPEHLPHDSEFGEPDQTTWRQINLLQHRGDGTEIEMELIRPQWWINLLGLQVGTRIELPFPELQTIGHATVLSIGDCPAIEQGEGRVVIGRFVTRQASNLVKVTLGGGNSFVGTDTHPIWSVDAQDWRRVDELVEGERLLSLDGETCVAATSRYYNNSDVFNLEVDGEHAYRLLEFGLLVHNSDYVDFFVNKWGATFSKRAYELGNDTVSGFKPHEALAGVRIEDVLGQSISRSKDEAYDFISAAWGKISLKGPLVGGTGQVLPATAINREIPNLATKVIRDAHPSVGADTVVVDLFGLTVQQAQRLKQLISSGLPSVHTPIKYLE